MKILLLGPQGSGKGTQAKRISAEYGIPHIATGDILRDAIARETPLGLEVKPVVESGRLVSDELMTALIRERLEAEDTRAGFVLDGFPRTLPQAEALDEMLREIGRELSIVFELQIPDEVCIDRLLRRAAEEGRKDDTPEVIARRLEIYHRETEPLIEHYRTQGIVVGVQADATVNEVFAQIQQALEQVAVR
jgi:adenylate kinase